MIHVNVRGLLIQNINKGLQLLIQLRKKPGEPEVYELPGGRINEYEKITDCLKREIMEETGLIITQIENEEEEIITKAKENSSSFAVECIRPYTSYQTIKGPVDSFGIYFVCHVEGELLQEGDATSDIHWADLTELEQLVKDHKFSEIDLPALLMFLKDYSN